MLPLKTATMNFSSIYLLFSAVLLPSGNGFSLLSQKDLPVKAFEHLCSEDARSHAYHSEKLNGAVPIIIPVGAIEHHDDNQPLGTDSIIAESIAKAVAAENNVMIGPTISYGVSMMKLCSSGSISLRKETYISMICDIVWSLAASSGYTHFFFINGHIGNVMPLKKVIDLIADGCPEEFSNKKNCYGPPKVNYCCYYASKESRRVARRLYGEQLGRQATQWPSPEEVALLAYLKSIFPQRAYTMDKILGPELSDVCQCDKTRDDVDVKCCAEGKAIFETAVAEMTRELKAFTSR